MRSVTRGDRADQHLGRRPGEHAAAVVLGDPVAVVAEPVGGAREVERVAQGLRRRSSPRGSGTGRARSSACASRMAGWAHEHSRAGQRRAGRGGAAPHRPRRADRARPPAHRRHRPREGLLLRRARLRRRRRGARRPGLGHDRRHPVRLRRRLPPPPRLQHVEVGGRRAAARRRRRPAPRRAQLPDARRASPTRCAGCRRPASSCASSPTTARTRPSTSPTPTATTSSSPGTGRSSSGRSTSDGHIQPIFGDLDLDDLLSGALTKRTALPQGSAVSPPSRATPAASSRASSSASAGLGEHDGPLAQADRAGRRGRHARAAPDVEAEVMVVAAGRHERGARHQRLDLEAEQVAVEGEAALDVADVQVQVADGEAGVGVALRLLAATRPIRPCMSSGSGRRSPQSAGHASRGRSAASSIPLPSGSGR